MKIGLVGYQGSGKSALFEWLTSVKPDLSLSHTSQTAMAEVPDERIGQLCDIYQPKKITRASIELVDTPGLNEKQGGNAGRLGLIRDTDCLVVLLPSFGGADPISAMHSFEADLILADLEIVSGRIEKLHASIKKPTPNREEQKAELAALEPLLETLEAGKAVREMEFNDEQLKITRSFQLLSQKPQILVINVADDEEDLSRFAKDCPEGAELIAVPIGLELELARMTPEEQQEFREEMEIKSFDRDGLLRQLMRASGQMLFFTAGEKEVRSWIIPVGGTALEAADSIHSDLARGFIRAETMSCDDIIRLGSEREIKAAGLMRQEPKDYVIQGGDIINIRFNV